MTRARWLVLLAVIAAVIGAFAAGRYTAREPDVQAEAKERTVYVEAFGSSEQFVLAREATTDTQTTRVTERGPVRTTWPDGRVEERGPEHVVEQTGTHATEKTQAEAVRVEYVDRFIDRDVEHRVDVVTPPDDWAVRALVGASGDGLIYGAQVDRRIAGPFHLSAGVLAGSELVGFGGVGFTF